jgi:hypothetical protein
MFSQISSLISAAVLGAGSPTPQIVVNAWEKIVEVIAELRSICAHDNTAFRASKLQAVEERFVLALDPVCHSPPEMFWDYCDELVYELKVQCCRCTHMHRSSVCTLMLSCLQLCTSASSTEHQHANSRTCHVAEPNTLKCHPSNPMSAIARKQPHQQLHCTLSATTAPTNKNQPTPA